MNIFKRILKYIFRPSLERALGRVILFFLSELAALGLNDYIIEFAELVISENLNSYKAILAKIILIVYGQGNIIALCISGLLILLLSFLIYKKANSIDNVEDLKIFDSSEEAFRELGPNKQFRYSELNKDWIGSPNSGTTGITKNK